VPISPKVLPAYPLRHRVSVAFTCHTYSMRVRVSTTVDGELLAAARGLDPESNDAALLDAALGALIARHRRAEVDASYSAYDDHPLSDADEWGDLESFRSAAAAS
jgi:hypothetical protein